MALIHVFDLGNVLLLYDHTPFYGKVAPRCRQPEAMREAVREHYRLSGIGRGGDFAGFYEGISRSLGMDMPFGEFRLAWSDIFTANPPMIEVVRQAPRPRFLLSNTDAIHAAWIRERFPEVFPLFDGCVLSNEVGAEKPEEAVYRQVERLSGAPADRHVFIDDVPAFVAAARALGWQAIQFSGVEDCVRRLAELNRRQ
jgi:putative hydrolase of the HAD superfamily